MAIPAEARTNINTTTTTATCAVAAFFLGLGACVGSSDCALQVNEAESVTAVFGPGRVAFAAAPGGGETRLATPALLTFVVGISLAAVGVIFIVPNVIFRLGELSSLAFGS